MIERIVLHGFNGFEREYDISKNTLILGKRGAGKSTIVKAIQFVLNTIPSANLQEMFNTHYDRARKDEKFSVSLTMDDGQIISRGLHRNEKGEVKQFFFDKSKKNLLKEQEANILFAIGADIPNINSFLELSDQKQIAYLFKKYQPEGVDIDSLSNQIEALKKEEVDQQNKIVGQRRGIQVLDGELGTLPAVPASLTIESIEKTIEELKGKILSSQEELNKIQQQEREEALRKQLEQEKNWLEQLKQEQKQEAVKIPTPFEVPKPQGETFQSVKETSNDCSNFIRGLCAQLDKIINAISKPVKCHKCKTDSFFNLALIPLELLKGEIEKWLTMKS